MSILKCRPASPNRRQSVFPAALAVLFVGFSQVDAQGVYAGGAFGGGVAILPGSHIEYFECNVKATGDGSAKGNIKFAQRGEGGIWFASHFRADCIHFLQDGRTAIVACTVVNDTDPEFIGTTATFTVRDNGHGPNAPPDEFTGVFYALNNPDVDEWTCESVLQWLDDEGLTVDDFLTPFSPGNFHVRP